MRKNLSKLFPAAGVLMLIAAWQLVCLTGLVPGFMLPSPVSTLKALVNSFPELMRHTAVTLSEALFGLSLSLAFAVILAVLTDRYKTFGKILYPIVVITQTIPVVAIAPLLVLWFGFGAAPKIVLITIVCFFPLAVGLMDGFKSVDPDVISLLRSMGAKYGGLLIHAKFPCSASAFFAGLKVAVSYSVVGAVISEWLGGSGGLGVYMTRVRKSYAYDKMFAVILVITAVSLLLIGAVAALQRILTPWRDD